MPAVDAALVGEVDDAAIVDAAAWLIGAAADALDFNRALARGVEAENRSIAGWNLPVSQLSLAVLGGRQV